MVNDYDVLLNGSGWSQWKVLYVCLDYSSDLQTIFTCVYVHVSVFLCILFLHHVEKVMASVTDLLKLFIYI